MLRVRNNFISSPELFTAYRKQIDIKESRYTKRKYSKTEKRTHGWINFNGTKMQCLRSNLKI